MCEWYVGVMALTQSPYVPDFDAIATTSCRILQIHKDDYSNALKWKNVINNALLIDLELTEWL